MLYQNPERELQILKLHKRIKYYQLTHEQKQYSHKRQLELKNLIQFKFTNSKSNLNYIFPLSPHQSSQDQQDDNNKQDSIQNLHSQNEEQSKKNRIAYYKIKQIFQGDGPAKDLTHENHENRYSKTSMEMNKTFKKNLNSKIFLDNYQSLQKKLNNDLSKQKNISKYDSNNNKYESIKKNPIKKLITEISHERFSSLEKQSFSKNSFNKLKLSVNPHDKQKNNSKYNTNKKLIQMSPFKENTILQNKSFSNKKFNPVKPINSLNTNTSSTKIKQNENLVTTLLNRLSSKQKQKQNYKNLKLQTSSNQRSIENNKFKYILTEKIYPETSKYSKKPNLFTQSYKFQDMKKLNQDIKINEPYLHHRIHTDIQEKNYKFQHPNQQISKRLTGEFNKKSKYKQIEIDTRKIDKKQNHKLEFYQSLKIKPHQYHNLLHSSKSNFNTVTNRILSQSKDNFNFKSNHVLNLNYQSPMNKMLKNKYIFTNR